MLAMSLIIATLGYVAYRWATRGERGSGVEALTTIAGSERRAAPGAQPVWGAVVPRLDDISRTVQILINRH